MDFEETPDQIGRGSQRAFASRLAKNSSEKEKIIHGMIEVHRRELESIDNQLAKEARKKSILTSIVKASVIFLGAFVAIKEVANQLIGASSTVNIVIFTVAGLLIAVLTGLEAAFKWENTSVQLKSLAAIGRAASRKAASNLAKGFATKQDEERLKELEKILDVIDDAIADTQKKASELGIETIIDNNVYSTQTIRVSDNVVISGSEPHID